MERLTIRINGKAVLKECTGDCMICNEAACRMNVFSMMNRLAAYEDTGMTPKEINRILDAYGRGLTLRTDVGERLEIVKDIPTERLREIAEAEKDGRLAVLPCKNDTVYTIEEDFFNCAECKHGDSAHYKTGIDRVSCGMDNGERCPLYIKEHKVDGFEVGFDASGSAVLSAPGEFGYEGLEQFSGIDGKVYYTREEAEAALKRREEGNEAN